MKQATAEILIDMFARHLGEQNNLLYDLQSHEASDEFEKIKTMIGQTMGAIVGDALNPLLEEHPQLKPPHLQT